MTYPRLHVTYIESDLRAGVLIHERDLAVIYESCRTDI